MTVHTLKYVHKRRAFCKAVKEEPEKKVPASEQPVPVPEPVVQQKPKITKHDYIKQKHAVNDYIKQNPDTVSSYLRNKRSMKAQRKQMHVRSLLNNAS